MRGPTDDSSVGSHSACRSPTSVVRKQACHSLTPNCARFSFHIPIYFLHAAGAPLGSADLKHTKAALGFNPEESFVVPDEVRVNSLLCLSHLLCPGR